MKDYWKNYVKSPSFDAAALKASIQKEKAERSLSEFIRQAWPIIEPGTKYIESWHIDLISEYLQAVQDGEIKRLIINEPPRHMKSIHVTVCFPVHTWISQPEKRFIKVSYSDMLSRQHNILSRDIIQSPWFQGNWGDRFRIKDDVNRQNEFRNNYNGMMYSTSTGGSLTGTGGDIIILDDPQNPQMANSEAEREQTIAFFKNTLQSRLNDPKTGVFIIVMQRLHEQDLTGHILAEGLGYEHLCLPAEAPQRTVVHFPKSGKEIIREEGDILNAERFSKADLDSIKRAMGSLSYAGQYEQRPAPADGNIFKREWLSNMFRRSAAPNMTMLIQSWDQPFTKSEGSAKCAGFVLGRSGSDIYIMDLVNDKMEFTESVAAMRTMTAKWPKARAKVVENKANGPAIVSLLKKEIPGLVEFNPRGSKEERAISVTPYFEAGNIHLPADAEWTQDLVNDLLIFPKGVYKDTVDALVQGILYLMDKPASSPPPKNTALRKTSHWLR